MGSIRRFYFASIILWDGVVYMTSNIGMDRWVYETSNTV
jgi:hypothetical protein